MKIKDIKENYYFETLSENHDLSEFDCGDEDLNDFLKNDALEQQKKKLNITKLVISKGETIGYFSLLTDALILKNINNDKLKIDLKDSLKITSKNKPIPAVKLGRFGIDKKYNGKGLGSHILRNILATLKFISQNDIGFRFIVVEGYANAFKFYTTKNGFEFLKKDSEKIEKIDYIAERDSTKTFYLYFDLEKL